MARYLSGADALADARLRSAALPDDQGILLLEGGDDVRLFGPHALSLQALIPCGNKRKLLDAYGRLGAGEEARFLFVADCDYDVPAGRLRPSSNLILTANVDAESDLLQLGVMRHMIMELVPGALASEQALDRITTDVTERVFALAEALGGFRELSARRNLGLSFEELRHRKYRVKGTANVDVEKLSRTLRGTRPDCGLSHATLIEEQDRLDGGRRCCHGKDLLLALAAVLHDDFGVQTAALRNLPQILRTASHPSVIAQWSVVDRIHAWEARTGRRVLR